MNACRRAAGGCIRSGLPEANPEGCQLHSDGDGFYHSPIVRTENMGPYDQADAVVRHVNAVATGTGTDSLRSLPAAHPVSSERTSATDTDCECASLTDERDAMIHPDTAGARNSSTLARQIRGSKSRDWRFAGKRAACSQRPAMRRGYHVQRLRHHGSAAVTLG
jgi:hypothetical protein